MILSCLMQDKKALRVTVMTSAQTRGNVTDDSRVAVIMATHTAIMLLLLSHSKLITADR